MSKQAEQSGRLNDWSAAQSQVASGRERVVYAFQLNPVTSGGPAGLRPGNFDQFPLWYGASPQRPPADGANRSQTKMSSCTKSLLLS